MVETTTMEPPVVSEAEWLEARKQLLAKEKQFTRDRDALNEERRRLPRTVVRKQYQFEGEQGRVGLEDLFGTHPQLIVYHFMLDPTWEEGCRGCSLLADNVSGALLHLGALNTAFAAVSRAPLSKLLAFKKRMGWSFPWYSSADTSFNYDFQVSLTGESKEEEYNYEKVSSLQSRGKICEAKGEMPGLSVFFRDGETVLHTYSTYGRGLDILIDTYNLVDMTPLGRQSEGKPHPFWWLRHHDKYETSAS